MNKKIVAIFLGMTWGIMGFIPSAYAEDQKYCISTLELTSPSPNQFPSAVRTVITSSSQYAPITEINLNSVLEPFASPKKIIHYRIYQGNPVEIDADIYVDEGEPVCRLHLFYVFAGDDPCNPIPAASTVSLASLNSNYACSAGAVEAMHFSPVLSISKISPSLR